MHRTSTQKGHMYMTEKALTNQPIQQMLLHATHTHTLLVHAPLSSCSCSRKACANTCLQMHLLCPHGRFWAKWPRYYLHWKTLESTVRLMQLKYFPLSKRAETWYAGPRAPKALRGSWRVQEVAMLALSTLPLCPHPAAPPGAFRLPGSLTRDGLFLSILRGTTFTKSLLLCQPLCEDQSHTMDCARDVELLVGQIYFYIPPDIWGGSRWEEFAHPAGNSQQPHSPF